MMKDFEDKGNSTEGLNRNKDSKWFNLSNLH